MQMRFLTVILLLAACSGCASVARIYTDERQAGAYPPTNAEKVKVYSSPTIEGKYMILGQVIASVDAGTDASTPVDRLREQAALLGADAIIDMRLRIDQGYWQNAIEASGTAIRMQ
jgi:hypothetical protein